MYIKLTYTYKNPRVLTFRFGAGSDEEGVMEDVKMCT